MRTAIASVFLISLFVMKAQALTAPSPMVSKTVQTFSEPFEYIALPQGTIKASNQRERLISLGGNLPSLVTFDPNQGMGNFPGVVTVTSGSSNIVVTGGTTSAVTVDLAHTISLSNGTTLQL